MQTVLQRFTGWFQEKLGRLPSPTPLATPVRADPAESGPVSQSAPADTPFRLPPSIRLTREAYRQAEQLGVKTAALGALLAVGQARNQRNGTLRYCFDARAWAQVKTRGVHLEMRRVFAIVNDDQIVFLGVQRENSHARAPQFGRHGQAIQR